MKVVDLQSRELEIDNRHWVLAEPLFVKWGCKMDDETVHVNSVDEVAPELSAWGIPWKRSFDGRDF